ncbi:alpha/beta hydrolase family protein [Ferruginibacter sp.]|nr:alpha/beta hydrolase [Ferruginibacter sp.]
MTATFIGSKQLTIKDELKAISFSVLVQYPTYVPSKPTAFGPYIMDVSVNSDIADGNFSLIIISHGTGGSPMLYRTISLFLAKNGYVAAMIEHYGNNRLNNELEGKNENFVNRLRHITLTIDYLFSAKEFAKCLQNDNVAVIGHSIGANTALVLAGGEPISYSDYRRQFGQTIHMGEETYEMSFNIDNRIKAVVLFALTPGWFTGDNSLKNINIPVLIYNAEKDDYIPDKQVKSFLEIAKTNPLIDFKIVKDAGHFSFLSPFPVIIKDKVGLAARDPEGFNRENFHNLLQTEIYNFLNNRVIARR